MTRIDLPRSMEQRYIDPDGVCIIEKEEVGEKVFVIELHRGKTNGAKRLLKQLQIYRVVIENDLVVQKYATKRNCRVLVVCEYESTQKKVIEHMRKDEEFERFEAYFLFKNIEV